MKKLLLLPVLIFFAACSTDTDTVSNEESVSVTTDNATHRAGTNPTPECLFNLTGSVYADVSAGIQNPVIVFSANVSGLYSLTQYFRASLIIEPLTDCEDINSGSGITTYYNLAAVKDPANNVPTVRLNPSQLPANGCYRWRFLVEQASGPRTVSSCIKYSQWYDAPLY